MSLIVPEYDSAARPPRVIEEFVELRANFGLVWALIDRNLKVRYKRSALGFLWTMLSPAVMLAALSLVFSRAFAAYTPAYAAYVFPGLLFWTFFAQTTTLVAEELTAGAELTRRMRFPKSALAIATTVTGLLNFMFAIVPLVIVLAVLRRPLGWPLLTLPVTLSLGAIFVLGVSLILTTAALHFADVVPAWSMLLPAGMLLAPVVYPAAILPPRLQSIVAVNPITIYVEAVRAPLYANVAPHTYPAMFVIAVLTLAAGWIVFTRRIDDIGRGN